MYLRLAIIPVVLFVIGGAAVAAESLDVNSAITEAVVYPASARVTRTAKVTLKEGSYTVYFKKVQPVFDENSISVLGKGTAEVKILGAGLKTQQLTVAADQRVRELESKIQELDDGVGRLQGEVAILSDKKAFLDSVRLFSGSQLPKDLVTKVPTAEELKTTLSFLEGELKAYTDARLALNTKLRDLAKERQALQAELDQLHSGSEKEERVLAVDLECGKAGDFDLELAYSVPAVSWSPLYDARVDFEKGKVALSAYAVVKQATGEDWTEVKLTLSTAKPAVGGRMPELNQWYLRPLMVNRQRNFIADSFSGVVMSKAAVRELASDELAEKADMPVPAAAPVVQASVSYAEPQTAGVSLIYTAAHPVTVKADGGEIRVPLMVQSMDVTFEYAATPKLSPYAYLKSSVTNNSSDQLMAGRMNAFLDGTYVGISDIPKTISSGESFDLYLGVDEGVVVKRELVEEKADDTFIGSIPSATKKISYKYKLTIENYKPRAVTVKLFDQIPVAQDDKIKVIKVQPSIKPDTEKYKDREGVYLWTLTLQPKEKKEIWLSYMIEYPRDLSIEGL